MIAFDDTVHSMRHLHVSWLLADGIDLKTIQDRVGHASYHTTMNTYAHLVDQQRQKAADSASSKIEKLKKVEKR